MIIIKFFAGGFGKIAVLYIKLCINCIFMHIIQKCMQNYTRKIPIF